MSTDNPIDPAATSVPTPYDEIIGDSNPIAIQARYEQHRTNRNAAQRARLLSGEVKSLDIDQTLYKITHPDLYPGFRDERQCLVFWARPPRAVKALIKEVQERLQHYAHALHLMAPERLHMTVMEVAHSLTPSALASRVETIRPKLQELTDYTFEHRARLNKPMVSYDASAVALSFVPAASSPGDSYTYHHLRRDMWALCRSTGVEVASRYVVPSAHLTLGRFVSNEDHEVKGEEGLSERKMKEWLEVIEGVNGWLRENYWPVDERDGGEDASGNMRIKEGGEWMVGIEKGLSAQAGTIWYGAPDEGELAHATLRVGKGF